MPPIATAVPTRELSALVEASRYAEAMHLVEAELLPMKDARPNDTDLLPATVIAADLYRDLARYPDAERLYLHALAVGRNDDPNRPRALAGLAGTYHRLDEFDRAAELFTAARAAFADVSDPVRLIHCLTGQADLLELLGRRREAVECVREARRVATTGGVGPTTLSDLLLAEVRTLARAEGLAASLPRAREAVRLRLQHSGERHFETGYAQLVLGSLLANLCHFDEAERLLESARGTYSATIGERHPSFATVLGALAGIQTSKGDLRTAEQLARRALGITSAALGDCHTWTAEDHRALGSVLAAANRYADAEESYTTATGILRERLGDRNPLTVWMRLEVAQLREATGYRRDAADITRGMLTDLQAWADDTRYEQGHARLDLMRLLSEAGDADEAQAEASRLVTLAGELGGCPSLAAPALLAQVWYDAQRGDTNAAQERLAAAERMLRPLAPNHSTRLQADAVAVSLDWMRGDAGRAVGRASETVRRCQGTVALASALCFLAEQQHQLGNLAEAERSYERALAEQRRLNVDNPEQVNSLRGLARVHLSRGNPAAAEVRFRRALELRRAAFGDRHPNTAEIVLDLAGIAHQAGDLRAAEAMYADVVSVRRECLGPTHPETVAAAHTLALTRADRGETTAAITGLEEALAALPERHPDRSTLRHSLARVHLARGEVRRSLELLAQVLADYEQAVGPDHTDLIPVLIDTARGHAAWWDHLEARRVLTRVRGAIAKSPFPRPLDEASAFLSLSDTHLLLGDVDRGTSLAEEALWVARGNLPSNAPQLIDLLLRTGEAARRAGKFSRAAGLLDEAESLVRQLGGEQHPLRANVWVGQAALAVARGRPARATRLYERAVNLVVRELGEDHSDHAAVRQMFGQHLQTLGQFQAAEGHLQAHLTVIRRSLGDDHPAVAGAHNGLAELHRQAGNLASAGEAFRTALALLRRTDQPTDGMAAVALHGLGLVLRRQGRLPEATARFEQALAVDRGTDAGEELFGSLESHLQLTLIEAATGFHAAALARVRRLIASREELVRAYACLPPGRRRDALLTSPRQLVALGLTLAVGGNFPADTVADAALRWNALRPADLAHGDRSVLRQRHKSDAADIDLLFDLNVQIADRQCRGAGLEGVGVHRELLARWTAKRDRLDDRLSGRLPSLARQSAWRGVTVDTVRHALPEGTALVELVRYAPVDPAAVLRGEDEAGPDRYAAVVVTATAAAVVDAGRPAGPSAVRAAVEPYLGDCTRVVVGHGRVSKRVWGRLAAQVRGVTVGRELISPLLAPTTSLGDRIRGWLGW